MPVLEVTSRLHPLRGHSAPSWPGRHFAGQAEERPNAAPRTDGLGGGGMRHGFRPASPVDQAEPRDFRVPAWRLPPDEPVRVKPCGPGLGPAAMALTCRARSPVDPVGVAPAGSGLGGRFDVRDEEPLRAVSGATPETTGATPVPPDTALRPVMSGGRMRVAPASPRRVCRASARGEATDEHERGAGMRPKLAGPEARATASPARRSRRRRGPRGR